MIELDPVRSVAERVSENVERVIVGKHREVELLIVALLCRGHVLLEDVPGVGKTVLAKAVAKSLGSSFKRIQFTPDLLPSDVTGVTIYSPQTGRFDFRPGPIMAQLVLADEINRATPKTQSALLEAMEESQVTVDGVTHRLPEPFIVLATENPIEYEGTFPLPEAQLDRFLLRMTMGYPGRDNELEMLTRQQHVHPLDALEAVVTVEELLAAQRAVHDVHVAEAIGAYIVLIVEGTRQHPDVLLGASPRGSLALYNSSRALAALGGRGFVTPDDVKSMAEAALYHRIIMTPAARMRNVTGADIVKSVLQRTVIPGATPNASVAQARIA